MKHTLLILCCIVSFSTLAQKVYIADTAFKTDVGYGGAPASCMCTGCSWAGQAMDFDDGWWLAEDFTVPAGGSYRIDTVVTYGYERYSSKTSTFNAAYLQIYLGNPSAGGTVVWGDATTNILASTAFTGIYRVPSGFLNDTSRPIMSLNLYLSPAPVLTAGTYWLVWAANGSANHFVSGSFKVRPGRINPSGQNGLQYNSYIPAWEACADASAHYGLNFVVVGTEATSISEIDKPTSFLHQNVPNPFADVTTISFELTTGSYGRLAVYNAIGQCVAMLKDGEIEAGKHDVVFNSNQLPNGIYYCQLSTTIGVVRKQMMLVK